MFDKARFENFENEELTLTEELSRIASVMYSCLEYKQYQVNPSAGYSYFNTCVDFITFTVNDKDPCEDYHEESTYCIPYKYLGVNTEELILLFEEENNKAIKELRESEIQSLKLHAESLGYALVSREETNER